MGVSGFVFSVFCVLLSFAECRSGLIGNLTGVYSGFLDDVYGYLDSPNVSGKCRVDAKLLLQLATDGDPEALKVLDSSGKPSSGILEGGVSSIGFYSECVHAKPGNGSLAGQYCLTHLNMTQGTKVLPGASWLVLTQSKPPTVGLCVPHSCTQEDVAYAATAGLLDNFGGSSASVSVCHTDETGFTTDVGAILALSVYVLVAGIAVSATICDYWLNRPKESPKEANKSISTQELCECKEPGEKSACVRALLSFSLTSNARKIFTVTDGGGRSIGCLHGLRFLSMALIILGHTYSFATANLFLRNPGQASQTPRDFFSQLFANGTFAVDTFYLISGLLLAFVSLKVMSKTEGKLPLLHFYVHRYFRLTPLMGAVILFCAYLLRYMGNGPNWRATIEMYDSWCKENGWTNMLYLHNFIHTQHMCLSHSWYLATDMQMYLVAPLILIPLYKGVKYGAVSMGIMMAITILTTAILTSVHNYPAVPYINNAVPLDLVNEYYANVYIKPYCRIGPYIIGIAVGYFLLHNETLELKKRTVVVGWLLFTTVILLIIYLMWPANLGYLPTPAEAAAYSSLARNVWAACMGWLVIACCYGYGGVVNCILSCRVLVPLSRLTYCAYLIHPVIMNAYYGAYQEMVDFSQSFLMYCFLGNICVTYALSVVLSLLFESPIVALEKVLLTPSKTKQPSAS